MHKIKRAALIAIGSVTGTMVFAGGTITGCAASNSGGDDTTEDDGGADSTAPKGDGGVESGHDSSTGTFDSTTGTGDTGTGAGDVTTVEGSDDTSTEIGDTGTGAGDTGAETGDAADTGTKETGDASDGGAATGDAGDTGTGQGDASDSGEATGEGGEDGGGEAAADGGEEAEAGCVTSLPGFSDAGTALLVTGFDNGIASGWSSGTDVALPDAGVTGSVAFSASVGRTCPGSIVLTVPFREYGLQTVDLSYDYNQNTQNYPPWTNHTKLHYWVKVAFEGDDGGVEPEAGPSLFETIDRNGNYGQWFDYKAQTDDGNAVDLLGPSFATQPWQEVVLTLGDDRQNAVDAGGFPVPEGTTCTATTGGACKFASQLELVATMPDGGPAAPTTTLLYVDDIWLE